LAERTLPWRDNPYVSYLRMSKVLVDIDSWIDQPGHEREIV
jgi:hypothetical protein